MNDPRVVRCTACGWTKYEGGICLECRRKGKAA